MQNSPQKVSFSDSSEVISTSQNIRSVTGHQLFARYWKPRKENNLRGLVFVAHGHGEHIGMYEELATKLVNNGFIVCGHDHLGHGHSEGKRVYVDNFDDFTLDVLIHAARIKSEYKVLPMYLYGHSMGGLIAIKTVLRNQEFFKGLLLEGPLILPNPEEVTPIKVAAVHLLGPLLPELQAVSITLDQITSDPEVQARLEGDRYRWKGGFKLKMLLEFDRSLKEIRPQLEKIHLPFLVLHGEKDTLCNPHGSIALYNEAKSSDKRLKLLSRAVHHPLLEVPVIRQQMFAEIITWLVDRSPVVQFNY